MSVHRLFAAAPAALLIGVAMADPAAARTSAQPIAASVYDFSLGRLGASTGALLGLAGVVIACLALARPGGRLGTANGPLGAAIATAAGLVAMALGGLVAATAAGGLGTGNGLGGAYVALLVGLVSTVLGGLALARSRRTG
ncbi:DUF6223 family protein [Allostreptomyces psammosilenae]|uniref:Uncharacterized protein n=1 Tax=Allostreptomyces psammosilenae TaxID=1892865 RepID=A0A852ZQD7_9ACTN|nr:DUF6223 family protein [Allostreptomyces psammosilenae]NYI04613.1 hypothetical protein [Allostreptomyces psammosilenae]